MTNTLQHTATHCNTLQHFSLDGKLSCELWARNSILASRVARAIHITQFSNTHDSIHRTRVARATHVSQFSNTHDSIQQHTWLHSHNSSCESNTHASIQQHTWLHRRNSSCEVTTQCSQLKLRARNSTPELAYANFCWQRTPPATHTHTHTHTHKHTRTHMYTHTCSIAEMQDVFAETLNSLVEDRKSVV